jgi:carbonic anhydrase/acetyltransferase-like protein (isoleucine patch superfamily)
LSETIKTIGINPGFVAALGRQGLDPTASPDDFFLEYPDPEQPETGYAVPRNIFVVNPLTQELSNGVLRENGAFVSDETKRLSDDSRLGRRAMLLGTSILERAQVGDGSVVYDATLLFAVVGAGSTINKNVLLHGDQDQMIRTRVDKNVYVGKNTKILGTTIVGPHSRIGDDVIITDSKLGDWVTVQDSDTVEGWQYKEPSPHRLTTYILNSTLLHGSRIGYNAQIESSTIGEHTMVGDGSTVRYHATAVGEIVPAHSTLTGTQPSYGRGKERSLAPRQIVNQKPRLVKGFEKLKSGYQAIRRLKP